MGKIIPVLDRLEARTVEVPCLVKGLHPKCWVFTGASTGRYPHISYKGRGRSAPKVAYQLTVGPVPDGMVLMALCATQSCWNPEHFRPATLQEVVAYHGVTAARARHARAQKYCKRGHEFSPGNTGKGRGDTRICLTCRNTNAKKWHAEWISKSKNPPRSKESRDAESAQCRRLRDEGMPIRAIAEIMSIAVSTVYERLKSTD